MLFLILSESTLPLLIWRALRRRPTCILAVHPLLGGIGQRLLDVILAELAARFPITRLEQHPDWIEYPDEHDLIRCEDVFASAEPWLDDALAMAQADRDFGAYAIARNHIVCNQSFVWYLTAARLNGLIERLGDQIRMAGIDPLIADYYAWRYGPLPAHARRTGRVLTVLINIAWTAAAALVALSWIGRRMRANPPPPQDVFLASDYVFDYREHILWDETVGENRDDLLVLFRNARLSKPASGLWCNDAVSGRDGVFSLGGGLAAMAEALRHMARLARQGIGLPTNVFRPLILQPFRRMTFRGLFNLWRPKVMWCRDEYNPEHSVRSQELRRVGGRSFGIMHGIPAICSIMHQVRYLDFDVFYLIGIEQYDLFYRRRWPAHMTVHATGCFGLSRADMRRMAAQAGRDVFCTLGAGFQAERVMQCFADIAQAFPDRTVFVNYKAKSWPAEFLSMVEKAAAAGPANLKLDTRLSYEVMESCGHVVTMGSTLTAEGLQLGRLGLVLDIDERYKALTYRRFPLLCVGSAAEAIERIRSLENGAWNFPWHEFGALTDLSGLCAWDIIRRDMGLPMKDQTLLPHPSRGSIPAALAAAHKADKAAS